jgi:hypothetical protein
MVQMFSKLDARADVFAPLLLEGPIGDLLGQTCEPEHGGPPLDD